MLTVNMASGIEIPKNTLVFIIVLKHYNTEIIFFKTFALKEVVPIVGEKWNDY